VPYGMDGRYVWEGVRTLQALLADITSAAVYATVPGNRLNTVLMAPAAALPSPQTNEEDALYSCTQVYEGGLWRCYRVDSLWLQAITGGVVSPLLCASIGQGGFHTTAYGGGPPGFNPSLTAIGNVSLPATVWCYAADDTDPCTAIGEGTPINLGVIYLGTLTPYVPTGVRATATPEFVAGISSLGATTDDDLGTALAWANSGLPDWVLRGAPGGAAIATLWPRGRPYWP
jgi:hypothetical protein